MKLTYYKELFEVDLLYKASGNIYTDKFMLEPCEYTAVKIRNSGMISKTINDLLRVVYKGVQFQPMDTELYLSGELPNNDSLIFKATINPTMSRSGIISICESMPGFIGFPLLFFGEKTTSNNTVNLDQRSLLVKPSKFIFSVKSSDTGSTAPFIQLSILNNNNQQISNELILKDDSGNFTAPIDLGNYAPDIFTFKTGTATSRFFVDTKDELTDSQMIIYIKINNQITYDKSLVKVPHTKFQYLFENQ